MKDWNEIEYQSLHSRIFSYIIKCIYNKYGQNYFSEPNGDIQFYNEFLMRNEPTRRIIQSSHNFIGWYLKTNIVTLYNVKEKQNTIFSDFTNFYPNSDHYKNFCSNIETIIR